MRARRHLSGLRKSASRRLLTLRVPIIPLSPPLSQDSDRLVAYTVIESWNLWSGFCRSLYVSCAIGAVTEGGHRISHLQPIGSAATDAILFAANVGRNKPLQSGRVTPRDEPAWQDPHALMRVVRALGASNEAQISAGLSLQSDVYKRMPTIRNFFAHRGEVSAQKAAGVARSLALNPSLRPSDLVVSCRSRRPQNVLADWIDDLRASIEIACQ